MICLSTVLALALCNAQGSQFPTFQCDEQSGHQKATIEPILYALAGFTFTDTSLAGILCSDRMHGSTRWRHHRNYLVRHFLGTAAAIV
jgi:hypothetical protein